ncbi:MAG: hypothetical protein HUK08_00370 [Bacteroidaceae bacterium]|nr:hypothetical protein [Bacteroidaceae bacterium]
MSETNTNTIVRGNAAMLILTLDAVDASGAPISFEIDPDKWTVKVKTTLQQEILPINEVEGNVVKCDIPANLLRNGRYSVEAYSDKNRFATSNAFTVVEYSAEANLPEGAEIQEEEAAVQITMTMAAGAGTSDYEELSNKPKINGVELLGDKTASQLGLLAESAMQQEQEARASADTQLQTAISTEASARQSQDSQLSNAISTEQAERETADNLINENVAKKLEKRNFNDTAYTFSQFKGWLSDANAGTGQPSCCGVVKFAAGECPIKREATVALQCHFTWLCEKQDGSASAYGSCQLYPADFSSTNWGVVQRVNNTWNDIQLYYGNIDGMAHIWTAANNFTGGLRKNGNDVLTVANVQDNLTSTATNIPLSANQGRVLNSKIVQLEAAIEALR